MGNALMGKTSVTYVWIVPTYRSILHQRMNEGLIKFFLKLRTSACSSWGSKL